MFFRQSIRGVIVIAHSLALAHCASSMVSTGPESAPTSTTCPAPGTRVPYAQLIAQTRQFVGCPVETEVAYVAAGMGGTGNVARAGESVFRVQPPGQSGSGGGFGAEFSYLTLPDTLAGSLFGASAGQRFVVRGRMDLQTYAGGVDLGNLGRTFRAEAVQSAP